jgi:molybdopterin molybdotransferase
MIGYEEALAHILNESHKLATEMCKVSEAGGRILAEAVVANSDLPPFDNSAMDGFALCTGGVSLVAGAAFVVAGSQAAGDADAVATDGAWEIMTGACLPQGLDAVVPVEQVDVLERNDAGHPLRIRLAADVPSGQHVRRRGEDVWIGMPLMSPGEPIHAQHVALLASMGVDRVAVMRRPRVAILTTGRELVDDPAQILRPGQIRNSNGPFLALRTRNAGAEVVYQATVGDDASSFLDALAEALAVGVDVIVSTGAVSMGRHDFVPDALHGIGARVLFHKVRIRPGKPLLFARLSAGPLFFGLPGNPVSNAVGLRFFVEPAWRAMLGMPPERPLKLPLAAMFSKHVELRFHLKGRVALADGGHLRAQVLPGQESFRIQPLLTTNAWIVVPEYATELAAGAPVDVYGLGHMQALPGSGGPHQ